MQMRSNSAKSTMLSRQSSRVVERQLCRPAEGRNRREESACGHRSKSLPAFDPDHAFATAIGDRIYGKKQDKAQTNTEACSEAPGFLTNRSEAFEQLDLLKFAQNLRSCDHVLLTLTTTPAAVPIQEVVCGATCQLRGNDDSDFRRSAPEITTLDNACERAMGVIPCAFIGL
jgi:hypothetical protein